MDKLNPDDPRPPYRQVADALRSAIHQGKYHPGDKLPPHGTVAEHYGVSVGTVKRAFADLQQDKLIVTRQGQGSYVRSAAGELTVPEDASLADLRRLVESLALRVEALEHRLPVAGD